MNGFYFIAGRLLYEYNNFDAFKRDVKGRVIELGNNEFFGTGHVIYKECFFYHLQNSNKIVKYNITSGKVEGKTTFKNAQYSGSDSHLYKNEYDYFDLAVDENGLWVIYGSNEVDDEMIVSKIDPGTLDVEKTWTLNVTHRSYGNGFISCGILYLVKDTRAKLTEIDFGYDLYEKQRLRLNLRFRNPFQMNNMIAYNPKEKQIYSWDKGNQLTYPLRV